MLSLFNVCSINLIFLIRFFNEHFRHRNAPLAQLVEQLTLNQWVPGSNPWRCTKEFVSIAHRVHLFPFRTQKLSCAEPKILAWRRAGKIGRCEHKRWVREVGVSSAQGPPVPIPNTEVKLCWAENTCLATSREDRSVPTQSCSFFIQVKFLPEREVLIPCRRNAYKDIFLHSSVGRAPDC